MEAEPPSSREGRAVIRARCSDGPLAIADKVIRAIAAYRAGRSWPIAGALSAMISSELAITASHRRREGQQRWKQCHLYPKIGPHLGDGCVCRRGAFAPPSQVRQGRRNREEPDHDERPDLGPEECVVRVVLPALRCVDRTGESDDHNEGGECAVP